MAIGQTVDIYQHLYLLSILPLFYTLGNDIGLTGVWTHALDNTDVTWFPRIQTCSQHNAQYSGGGDALLFYIGCPRIHNGAYCDGQSSESLVFI